jgi:hypothetical protein
MPTLGIRLYAFEIQYVYTKYGLDTKGQKCKETSVLALEKCTVYEIKT